MTGAASASTSEPASKLPYRVAVAAALAGSFSLGDAAWEFVRSAAGGVAIGLAVGWIGQRLQRRLSDAPLAIFLSVRRRARERSQDGCDR